MLLGLLLLAVLLRCAGPRRELARAPTLPHSAPRGSPQAILGVISGKVPGVATMVAEGHSDGIPFIVMERLENTLTNKLYGKKGKLSWSTVFDFARQLATTFDYLHRTAVPGHSVIHRDLKVGWSDVRARAGRARRGRVGPRGVACGRAGVRGAEGAEGGMRAAHGHSPATHRPPTTAHKHHSPTTRLTPRTQPDNIMFRPIVQQPVERNSSTGAAAAEGPKGSKYIKSDDGSWSKRADTSSRAGLVPQQELVLVDFGLVSVVSGVCVEGGRRRRSSRHRLVRTLHPVPRQTPHSHHPHPTLHPDRAGSLPDPLSPLTAYTCHL